MTSNILTVEAAANLLQLHPKTVLRHIREGRLRATKVGKQYRVLHADVLAFASAGRPAKHHAARVTSIVDVTHADAHLHQRLSAILLGAAQGKEPADTALTVNIAHDPALETVKVVLIGRLEDTAMCLKLIGSCVEQ